MGKGGCLLLWEGPERLHDGGELVEVRVSGKEGLAREALGKETADGPDVDLCAVRVVADKELWRAVPASGNVLCVPPSVSGGEHAGKAKVAQLEDAVLGQQQVLGLDIAVDDVVGVAKVDRAEQRPHHPLHVVLWHSLWCVVERLQHRSIHSIVPYVER